METRTGDFVLYIKSIHQFLPRIFSYDQQNYVRYLILQPIDTIILEQNRKCTRDIFWISHLYAGRLEKAKVIQNNINKDTKKSVGKTGIVLYSQHNIWTYSITYMH